MLVDLSVVIPVYNGAAMLASLCARLVRVCEAIGTFEIVLADDGSTDGSDQAIAGLCAADPRVVGVILSRNFGQHNATLAGMAASRGRLVVTMDQDLQNPPEELPRLVAALRSGYDVVYGLPARRAHGWFRNVTSELTKWWGRRVFPTAVGGTFSSFRALDRWVVLQLLGYQTRFVYLDGLISWTTAHVGAVEVRNDRSDHRSQYNLGRLVRHGMNLLVGFSIRPLQMASMVGVACALLGLLWAGVVVYERVVHGLPVAGWASLMVTVLVMGGVQLLFLGLLGEYVGRMLFNTNQSPRFVVRRVLGREDEREDG